MAGPLSLPTPATRLPSISLLPQASASQQMYDYLHSRTCRWQALLVEVWFSYRGSRKWAGVGTAIIAAGSPRLDTATQTQIVAF